MCSTGVIWRKGANKSSTNTWTLGACVVWSRELLSRHTARWAWVSLCTWISSSAVETHETQSGPPSCDTVHGRMNNIAFPSLVGLQALGERLPESYSAVRNFSGTRDWLRGRHFFHRPGKEGWFKLFICCAPYFHCYCISSISDLHALDLGGWGLLYKTRSLYFSSASSLFTFSPPTTCMPGTQRIGGDSKPHLSLATYDGDFCISSSSHGNYSHTWKLGRQSVHVLSMWLSAYVCTSFFRKFYFTLQQLDE